MSQIDISSIEKRYGNHEVIHGIDVKIEDGEFAVLVGPSGCGKSTLLRMIAGLEDISGGEISIGGKVVNDLPPKERNIAMVFQNYALYPHMTVAENMGFSLKLAKADKGEIAEKVKAAADILGLHELLERYPRQLSGGQRQRVAMGRAIVRDPSVFLFDEPLSNLDAKLRVKMRTEIKALHQKLKNTIVYVTHDQIEAMTMADKIIVLEGGFVSQVGTPLELYDNPRNTFVATFIGSPSMNLIGAKVIDSNFVELETGQGFAFANELEAGREIKIGIRPEHMHLADEASDTTVATQVMVVEPTGAETHVICSNDELEILAAIRDRVDLVPGQKINLSVDAGRLHVFCAKSGLAIEAKTGQ
ncbi:ABC transporter ATP-binding protein [Polycladidibacter hongkongensis]|uniref:ABC transporter ATP-binding protein n=1 Tax=Polycladidibacter hongkongensis TaxID=1647556 RepID=UPI000830089C|nr:sn-glycerol-3-phosphate ABC transporter ATP-binding protein UgpC [Pseudovibrio hongkongensis]